MTLSFSGLYCMAAQHARYASDYQSKPNEPTAPAALALAHGSAHSQSSSPDSQLASRPWAMATANHPDGVAAAPPFAALGFDY